MTKTIGKTSLLKSTDPRRVFMLANRNGVRIHLGNDWKIEVNATASTQQVDPPAYFIDIHN